jgi:hypothetical protein
MKPFDAIYAPPMQKLRILKTFLLGPVVAAVEGVEVQLWPSI